MTPRKIASRAPRTPREEPGDPAQAPDPTAAGWASGGVEDASSAGDAYLPPVQSPAAIPGSRVGSPSGSPVAGSGSPSGSPAMSMRAYARHRGVTHTTVMMAVRTGRISINADGKIDPVQADQEWAMSTDLTKPLNSVTGSTAKGSQRKQTGSVALNFNAARAAHETYKARRAKLEFEQLAGKLVNAEDVRRRWFTAGRRVRDSIMTVADRVAPIVTGMNDSSEVHRIIANELRTALEELTVEPDKEV